MNFLKLRHQRIHSSTIHYANLQEYITYALEILFSVTEGEFFLVSYVCLYVYMYVCILWTIVSTM